MRKAKSPIIENKENDCKSSTSSPNPLSENLRVNKGVFSKISPKTITNPVLGQLKTRQITNPRIGLSFKPISKPISTKASLGPKSDSKPHEYDKIQRSILAFKKSFKIDKGEFNMKYSSKLKEGIVSERHSAEHNYVEEATPIPKSTRKNHLYYQSFKESDVKISDFTSVFDRSKQGLRLIEKKPQKYEKSPLVDSNVSRERKNSIAHPQTMESSLGEMANHSRPTILTEHFDTIEKKFVGLKRIFANENDHLNYGQLSIFLSKLGWISELDKNLEIQKAEDELLVGMIHESLRVDNSDEISFSSLKRVLALISGIFANKTFPKIFDTKEKILTAKMTTLSNKKLETGSKASPKDTLLENLEMSGKPDIMRVQSCTSTPKKLAKYCNKFDALSRPIIFPTIESDMQFSFRKASEKKNNMIEIERFMNRLDYVDVNNLNTLGREPICQNINTLDSHFANSEDEENAVLRKTKKDILSAQKSNEKSVLDLTNSIYESKVIENDYESMMDAKLPVSEETVENNRKGYMFGVTIQIGEKKEYIDIYMYDDLKKVASDFVKKHGMEDQYLLVYEGLQEQYQKFGKRVTK